MIAKKYVLQPLAVAALVFAAGASQAAFIRTFTDVAAFNAATSLQGTDQYTGFLITDVTPSPIMRNTQSGVSYGYTASAFDDFFGGGTLANPFLSPNTSTSSITFSGFSTAVRAIGGNFFGSDINGAFAAGDIMLTFTDSLGASLSQTITNATQATFRGVLSNASITSLTVTSVQPRSGDLWPSVDNLVMGVPEPGTYGLALAALGLAGFITRRRRS